MPVLRNQRHERFAQGMADGKSVEEAHVEAGYCRNRRNAYSLRQNEGIATRLCELLEQRERILEKATVRAIEKTALTKEWIIEKLVLNVERALQEHPVIVNGEPTGEFVYNGNVANRALELLGRERGLFIERREIGEPGAFDGLSDDEVSKEIRRQAAELGIAPPVQAKGKTQH